MDVTDRLRDPASWLPLSAGAGSRNLDFAFFVYMSVVSNLLPFLKSLLRRLPLYALPLQQTTINSTSPTLNSPKLYLQSLLNPLHFHVVESSRQLSLVRARAYNLCINQLNEPSFLERRRWECSDTS